MTKIGQFAADTPTALALDPRRALLNDAPDSLLESGIEEGVIARIDVRLATGFPPPALSDDVESADSSIDP